MLIKYGMGLSFSRSLTKAFRSSMVFEIFKFFMKEGKGIGGLRTCGFYVFEWAVDRGCMLARWYMEVRGEAN